MENQLNKLMYLDREFISALYEQKTGTTPEAVITRTEGLHAGVQIPLFNAKASSVESKSYSLSSHQMLSSLSGELATYPSFANTDFDYEQPSVICWVEGMLSAPTIEVTRTKSTFTLIGKSKKHKPPKKKIVSKEKYWQLITSKEEKFALVTSNEYFSSGVEQFPELVGTVINQLVFPVESLVRVYSAKSAFQEWVAVPLVIRENGANKSSKKDAQTARASS